MAASRRYLSKKQTWSLNDTTILLNLVIEKYNDLSVSRRSIYYVPQPFYSYNTGGNEAGVDHNPSSFIMLS